MNICVCAVLKKTESANCAHDDGSCEARLDHVTQLAASLWAGAALYVMSGLASYTFQLFACLGRVRKWILPCVYLCFFFLFAEADYFGFFFHYIRYRT